MTVDPTRCPDCGEHLTGSPSCEGCGLLLRGPLAARLWQVTIELDRLSHDRAMLLDALRPGGTVGAATALREAPAGTGPARPGRAPATATGAPAATVPAATVPTQPDAAAASAAATAFGARPAASRPVAAPPAAAPAPRAATPAPRATASAWTSGGGAGAYAPPPARRAAEEAYRRRPEPRPRKEWTPERVQNVLLATGALLLVVAAIAFTAFAWGRLPIAARGAIMLAVTGVTGWTARWVYRRGLTASAEAIALVTVLFGAVDAYAAHRTDLGGLGSVDPATYWSVATGVLAALSAAFGRVVPVRSVRYAALAGAQLPLLITAARLPDLTPAERGAFLVAQAAGLAAVAYRLGGTAVAARASAVVTWAGGVVLALTTAYATSSPGDARGGALVLVAAGLVALLAPGDRTVPAGVATAFAVAAVVAPARLTLTAVQLPAAIAAAGLVALVAAAAAQRAWRTGPVVVGAGTVGLALAAVSPWVGQALALPFTWLADPWRLAGDRPSRAVLAQDGTAWGGSVVTLVVVVVAVLAVVVTAEVFGRWTDGIWWSSALAAAAVVVLPLGFAWSYRAALAVYAVAGVAALAASYALRRAAVAVPASLVLAVATAWSLADERMTLVVVVAVTVAYAAYAAAYEPVRDWAAAVAAAGAVGSAAAFAAAAGAPADRTGFVVAATAFALMGLGALLRGRVASVELVAAAAYALAVLLALSGAGWLAWTLGGGALTATLTALRPERRSLPGFAALLTAGCAAATGAAYELAVEPGGLAVALTACAILGAGVFVRRTDVQLVGVAAYGLATVATSTDLTWLSYALAAGAVTTGALAVRERLLTPVAAALAVGCAGTSAYALGAPLDRTGFVVALAALAALGLGVLLRDDAGEQTELVAAVGYVAALGLSFAGTGWTAWTLGAGAAAAAANAVRPARRPLAAVAAALTVGCAAATSAAFGLAPEQGAFAVAATACAVFAVAAVLRLRHVAVVGAAAYVGAVAVATADLGWLSWTLGLGAVTAAAAAYVDRQLAPVAAGLAIACAGTTSVALGAPLDRTGFVVALAALAAVVAGVLLRRSSGEAVEATGVAGYLAGTALAAPDPGWLSWVLLAGGVTALVVGLLRPERRYANWVATVLLTLWSWDRLFLEDVRMPEAYAAPVAGLLLALGHLRRRRDPSTGSWTAYGRGLTVAFAPTTYLVLTEPGVARPVALAVAGVVVLLAGVRERLQAPLTVGAVALGVDALVQLVPVAVALPKWATIGAVGLLVIAVGVTYEDRRRDVAKLRDEFESLA